MNNTPRKSRPPYYPSDHDRAAIAAMYDNAYKAPTEPIMTPADYTVNGLTVALNDGATNLSNGACFYWIYSLDEAKEAKVCREEGELFIFGRRKFLIVLA